MLLGDNNGVVKSSRGRPALKDHRSLETYLERYRGLLLYLKEMDESSYAKLCAVRKALLSPSCASANITLSRRTFPQSASCTPNRSRRCFLHIVRW